MCWVQYADIVNIHQRQNILLGLALTEQTISLKTTPRSSYTQLLNQDGFVLYYKTFSFPPPACLPHSLSIDYHSATWKFPEGNYLAAIQDINKNCSFLWQVAVLGRGGGTNTGQMNLCRLCHSPCSSFDSPLASCKGFGRGPGFLRSYLLPLGLIFFLPPELWQTICSTDDAALSCWGALWCGWGSSLLQAHGGNFAKPHPNEERETRSQSLLSLVSRWGFCSFPDILSSL